MLDEATKAQRIGLITSSVIGAALGLDKDMSPIDAWLSIKGLREFSGNEATFRGDWLEDRVLAYGATVLGASEWRKPAFVSLHNLPWAGDSCDAVYLDDWGDLVAVGEGKTAAMGQAFNYGEVGTDQVPAKTLTQACWHLLHYPEAPVCVVPVLVGGWEFAFRHYMVERNEELIGILVQDAEKWHRDFVVADRQPPITWADSEFLKSKYPRAEDAMMEATSEFDLLALEAIGAQLERKAAEERYELTRNRLREALGIFAGVKGEGYSISNRNNEDSLKTDWEALARHLGASAEQIEQFTRVKAGPRVLRVAARKMKSSCSKISATDNSDNRATEAT